MMFDLESIKIVNSLAYYIIFVGAVFIPPLFWLWYFRFHDCRKPEPLKLLFFVFVLGGLSCLILRLFFKFLEIPSIYNLANVWGLDILAKAVLFVLVLAGVEEFLKFIVLRFYVYYKEEFDERIDGMIYGITVGLGFATCENIAQIIVHGPEVIFSRFATATLLHAVLGGVMGSFLAAGKFSFFKKCCLSIRALLLSIVLHFVYNIFVIYDLTGLGIRGEVLWVFGIFILLMIIIININKKECGSCTLDKNN